MSPNERGWRVPFVLVPALLFAFAAPVFAQDNAPDSGPDHEQALVFLHQSQAVLRHDNPAEVGALVHYPLLAYVDGHSTKIRTRVAFLQNYAHIFTAARRSAILRCADGDMWWRDQGYSIPEGVIWFDYFPAAGPKHSPVDSPEYWTAGKFGLMTVNSASGDLK